MKFGLIFSTTVNICFSFVISSSFFFNSKVPLSTIYHGVDQNFCFTPSPQKSIKHFSQNKPFIISYISIIDVYKNHLNVFKAVKEIIDKKNLPLHLQFIGSSNSKFAKNLLAIFNIHNFEVELLVS